MYYKNAQLLLKLRNSSYYKSDIRPASKNGGPTDVSVSVNRFALLFLVLLLHSFLTLLCLLIKCLTGCLRYLNEETVETWSLGTLTAFLVKNYLLLTHKGAKNKLVQKNRFHPFIPNHVSLRTNTTKQFNSSSNFWWFVYYSFPLYVCITLRNSFVFEESINFLY